MYISLLIFKVSIGNHFPEKSCFIDICCVSKPYSLNISVEFSPPSVTGKNDDLILLYLNIFFISPITSSDVSVPENLSANTAILIF